MKTQETYTVRTGVLAKLKDLALLFKLRVNLMVMISALLGYALGVPAGGFNAVDALLLAIGGLLVAGSSVAFNEVIEVEQDARMARTKDRPLVSGSMGMGEAITIAVLAGAAGTFILWSAFGQFTAVLSLLTLFIYVALYTPLKRLSPWATFVGAIPGAFPPLLGYVAATGTFGLAGGLLFALQFLWQFP
ncbi:MAG: protoheme IX farnesyltransferase, partial [Bacteroidetes bacterium]|nr:protoheme IX farnesyltransferase [Bacteroidota bacterium]